MKRARHFANRLGMIFDEIVAARSIAAAMDAGHRPPASALRTLGLEENVFGDRRHG